jgi:ribosomal protein L32
MSTFWHLCPYCKHIIIYNDLCPNCGEKQPKYEAYVFDNTNVTNLLLDKTG